MSSAGRASVIDWGDESPLEDVPANGRLTHRYRDSGTYHIAVSDWIERGTHTTHAVTVTGIAPTVTAEMDDAADDPAELTVKATASYPCIWYFETPPINNEPATTCSYRVAPGARTITARPTHGSSIVGSTTITVPGLPPFFTAHRVEAEHPDILLVQLDMPSYYSCLVDWGDGSPEETVIQDRGTSVQHSYTDFGTYTVRLKHNAYPQLQAEDTIVLSPSVTGLRIDTKNKAPARLTETLQLQAMAEYADNSEKDVTLECAWSSDDPKIVHVDQTGLCRKQSPGMSTIRAEYTDDDGTVLTAEWPTVQ